MPRQDPPVTDADRPRRLDIIHRAHAERRPPGRPRIHRYRGQADGDHRVRQTRTQHGQNGHRQQNLGKGQQDFHDRHEHAVYDSAVESGQDSDHRTKHQRDADRDEPDPQRDAGAVDDPAQHIATQLVSAERKNPRRRAEHRAWDKRDRIVRREQRGGQRQDHKQREHGERGDHQRPAAEPTQNRPRSLDRRNGRDTRRSVRDRRHHW